MRALTLAAFAASLLTAAACVPGEGGNPDLLKQPKGYDPVGADLTFNKEGLEKYNMLSPSEREAYVEELKSKEGSFKGMAVVKSGAGLGESMADSQYGSYELAASVNDPVLFEITIDYSIFTDPEEGKKIARNRAVEFTGTLVELDYQDENKPRKLTLKVKASDVKPIED